MSIKLTETQLAMLSAALMRDDKCVLFPATLRGAQRRKAGEKLIDAGYMREVKAKPTSPIWRNDDATGSSHALKLTAAGAKAAKDGEPARDTASPQSGQVDAVEDSQPSAVAVRPSPTTDLQIEFSALPLKAAGKPSAGQPRAGSKIAGVIALLERDGGATVAELIVATNWLPHTTRAALTGLRKRGCKIVSDRSDRERGSVYRIELDSAATGPGPSNEAAEAP